MHTTLLTKMKIPTIFEFFPLICGQISRVHRFVRVLIFLDIFSFAHKTRLFIPERRLIYSIYIYYKKYDIIFVLCS
ncbi:hypothetical protein DAPPUDRAFT_299814 [Daphnia pulex]|uniref:Uncharacterized protein n=1 Tax=Daphnia pulex TaxID=6669 RepID=E9FRX7_DAPPU|nr:hypothetical protein DAPPUDRAFT_299814 [Daphnia pulex]|eukprot:EFX89927.1 hypothetical protein DAPPUDRAFT_299814 [Daphnia pulex]